MDPLNDAIVAGIEIIADRAKAEAEHAKSCKLPECERCERWLCTSCGGVASQPGMCVSCSEGRHRSRWLAPAIESVPRAFHAVTFEVPWLARLVGAQAIQAARGALTASRVAFVGPPGSGKTSLAIAMFRAVLAAEPTGHGMARHRYVSAHALAKARAGHPLGRGEAPLVAEALEAPLLVIDELGGEDARHASAVAEVIYERHAAEMPTWVTTGTTSERLADRYGGGIARRLSEGATVIRLTGRR